MENEEFKDNETTTRIERHIPNSVSVLTNLIHEGIFPSDPDLRDLVSSFNDALVILVTKRNVQMKMNFLEIETAIKSKLGRIVETVNQRRTYCVGIETGDKKTSTQFLQMQKINLLTCSNSLKENPVPYQSLV